VPPEEAEGRGVDAMMNPVSPDFFRVLGVPVLEGRGLTSADDQAEPPGIILSRVLADELFPEGGSVGSLLRVGRASQFQVVGVVADFKFWGLDQQADAGAFVSYRGFGPPLPELSLAARSTLPVDVLAESLRQTVWTLDPDLPIDAIVELDRQISQSIAEPRFYSTLLLVFAGLALALAAAGICGSLLFTVGQRMREMGVRLALGAARGDVVRMVVAQGLGLVAVGLGLGLAITLAAGRLIESRLFGIGASDPWTLAIACAVLAGVGLLACWLPARRAAATDPVTTLRAD
jgi:putative ABC transport system permease protein